MHLWILLSEHFIDYFIIDINNIKYHRSLFVPYFNINLKNMPLAKNTYYPTDENFPTKNTD